MKSIISILLLFPLALPGFSQEKKQVSYDIRADYKRAASIDKIAIAETMVDINPGYPAHHISESDYISAAIQITSNGKVQKAMGENYILNEEQKRILSQADLGADIEVEVKYRSKNIVTEKIEVSTMKFEVTLVPQIEAEYTGGYKQLRQYLKEAAIDKIPVEMAKKLKLATVSFAINEEGKPDDIRITKTSEDKKIDKLLIEAIQNMPAWTPAKNSKCAKVRQNFEFSVGLGAGPGC